MSDQNRFDEGIQAKKAKNAQRKKDDSLSNLLSFSRFTLLGVSLFMIVLLFVIIVQLFHLSNPNLTTEELQLQTRWLVVGPLILSILTVLLGLEIDILRRRDFSSWGALGAFVAYIGQLMFFMPVILYLFYIGDNTLYLIIILIGIVITIIGFTSRATELDQKIEDLLFLIWSSIKNFDIRKFFSTLARLFGNLIFGTLKYIGSGLKTLRSRVKVFVSFLNEFAQKFIKGLWQFITKTIPLALEKLAHVLWDNIHWIGLLSIIIYLLSLQGETLFLVNLELLVIVLFATILGIVYPNKERVESIIHSVQEYSWKASFRVNYHLKTILDSKRKTKCLSCGEIIPLDSKDCPSCNKEIKKCMVCLLPIKEKKNLIECPYCHNSAHKEHWKFWLNIENKCPICRKVIDGNSQNKNQFSIINTIKQFADKRIKGK